MNKITAKWSGNMAFQLHQDGHKFYLDASEDVGGNNKGPRPKALLLSGLAGCTGMDVVSILKKMKITDYQLEIDISGELTDEHPKVYNKILIQYIFTGKDLPLAKLQKAVELSETRYCGVSAMLGKTAEIKTKITLK